jgi:hypothetical protein
MPLLDVSPDLIPKLLVVRVAVYCCPVLNHSFDEFLCAIGGDSDRAFFWGNFFMKVNCRTENFSSLKRAATVLMWISIWKF